MQRATPAGGQRRGWSPSRRCTNPGARAVVPRGAPLRRGSAAGTTTAPPSARAIARMSPRPPAGGVGIFRAARAAMNLHRRAGVDSTASSAMTHHRRSLIGGVSAYRCGAFIDGGRLSADADVVRFTRRRRWPPSSESTLRRTFAATRPTSTSNRPSGRVAVVTLVDDGGSDPRYFHGGRGATTRARAPGARATASCSARGSTAWH